MWAQRASPGLKVLLSAWTVWASNVPRGQRETWAWLVKRNIRVPVELKVNNKRDLLIHTTSHYQRPTWWEPAKWPRLMMPLCSSYKHGMFVVFAVLLHFNKQLFCRLWKFIILLFIIMVWYFCCYLIFVISNVKLNALNARFQFKLSCWFICLFFFMFHEVICLCLHFFPRVHNVFVNGRSDRVRDKLLHKI